MMNTLLARLLLVFVMVYAPGLDVALVRADGSPLRGLAGKCVDVAGANPADGTSLILWSCHGQPNQKWELQADRTLRGLAGKCVDVAGANSADGTALILWSCHGQPNQQWELQADGTLRGLAGKCVDVAGANSADGTALILWSCHGGPNQQWSGGKILKRPFNIVAVGDSIMWGQGLSDQNKFVTLVRESLKKQLGKQDVERHVFAHSGAITYPRAGGESADDLPFPDLGEPAKEIPHDYPSVYHQIRQLAPLKVHPAEVDLVLLDGCLNNVNVRNIIIPTQSTEELRRQIRGYCDGHIGNILAEIGQNFPHAKVVVVGYPLLISGKSNIPALMEWWAMLRVPPPAPGAQAFHRDLAAGASELLLTESESALRSAVSRANAALPPEGGNRFRYAAPAFKPENAYGADPSWLWRAPGPLPVVSDILRFLVMNPDEAFNTREEVCRKAYNVLNPLEIMPCQGASMGHPNVEGARQYAYAIEAAVAEFLPEWRAAFGTSPLPDPPFVPRGVMCRSGQQGCGPMEDGTFERCIPEDARCE